jgi:hypothetical protein
VEKHGVAEGLTLSDHGLFSPNPVSLTILLTLLVLALFVVEVDLFEIVELKTYSSPFAL